MAFHPTDCRRATPAGISGGGAEPASSLESRRLAPNSFDRFVVDRQGRHERPRAAGLDHVPECLSLEAASPKTCLEASYNAVGLNRLNNRRLRRQRPSQWFRPPRDVAPGRPCPEKHLPSQAPTQRKWLRLGSPLGRHWFMRESAVGGQGDGSAPY